MSRVQILKACLIRSETNIQGNHPQVSYRDSGSLNRYGGLQHVQPSNVANRCTVLNTNYKLLSRHSRTASSQHQKTKGVNSPLVTGYVVGSLVLLAKWIWKVSPISTKKLVIKKSNTNFVAVPIPLIIS